MANVSAVAAAVVVVVAAQAVALVLIVLVVWPENYSLIILSNNFIAKALLNAYFKHRFCLMNLFNTYLRLKNHVMLGELLP